MIRTAHHKHCRSEQIVRTLILNYLRIKGGPVSRKNPVFDPGVTLARCRRCWSGVNPQRHFGKLQESSLMKFSEFRNAHFIRHDNIIHTLRKRRFHVLRQFIHTFRRCLLRAMYHCLQENPSVHVLICVLCGETSTNVAPNPAVVSLTISLMTWSPFTRKRYLLLTLSTHDSPLGEDAEVEQPPINNALLRGWHVA